MPLPTLFCKTIFILHNPFLLGVKMILQEKWWSQNPPSHLKHLTDSTQKYKLHYLFIYLSTALTTLVDFFPMLLPCVSYWQSFPVSSALLGAPQTASSASLSLLSKRGNDMFSHCVLRAIKCYLFRGLTGWGKKCGLKTKAKIQEISPSYSRPVIPWKSRGFWEMLGWYLLHTASPEQGARNPWQWWQMFKSKNNPWRFQGRMKTCAGVSTHERMWVTKLVIIKTCPSNQRGCVGLPAQDRWPCWGLEV